MLVPYCNIISHQQQTCFYVTENQSRKETNVSLFTQESVDVLSPFSPLPIYTINTPMCSDPCQIRLDSDLEEEDEEEDNGEDSNFEKKFFN